MKHVKTLALGFLMLLGISPHAKAEQEKVQSKQILQRAFQGQLQEVIVQFDGDATARAIYRRRNQVEKDAQTRKRAAAASPAGLAPSTELMAQIETERSAQDAALVGELRRSLGQIKADVFESRDVGGAHITHDFPNLTAAMVSIPNAYALNQLLQDARVKSVAENSLVYMAANWAAGRYTDISSISGPAFNSSAPRTGRDTRVVVIDGPAYLGGLEGFTDVNVTDQSYACAPYHGDNFTNNNLAGGTNAKPQCRVWDAYNFAIKAQQYCANPYGTYITPQCKNHEHGTAVMNTILRTAPSTYITALQVFDRNAISKQEYVLDALNWVIANAKTQPRIVAVNLSIRMSEYEQKYTDYCQNVPVAESLYGLLDLGIIPVAASGNFGFKDGVSSPACVEGVLSVGAVADSSTLPLKLLGRPLL